MDDNPPVQDRDESEAKSLKKTTRIFLNDALSAKPAPKKATTALLAQTGGKKDTAPIMGIPTHTAPIPQTIRLKRPSTSPIVISPADITTSPTVVKTAHPKSPSSPIGETATIIKKPLPPRPSQETSRIILELEPRAPDVRSKTAPLPAVSSSEATPGPKTIRLKRPSTIIAVGQPEEKPALPSAYPPPADFGAPKAAMDMQATQTAKKSETAKIELPKDTEYQTPATQRKTIKIKRTDRNILARTVIAARKTETKPQAEAVIQSRGEAARDQKAEQGPQAPFQDEPLPVFSVLAGLAAACLASLVYLLAAQAFGPKLILPVPSGLF